jgi:dienelactone hydrolase
MVESDLMQRNTPNFWRSVTPRSSAWSLGALAALALFACTPHSVPPSESPTPAQSTTDAPTVPAPSAVAAALAITTSDVTYKAGNTELKGYLAAPAQGGPYPAVLVVHEWWGQNDYPKQRARMLAELGYVAFAVDMYGNGKTTADPKEANQLAGAAYADLDALKQRFLAAREVVSQDPRVDAKKIGALGYCFGGGVVLNMVRMGVPLDAAASFHGTLKTEHPLQKGTFTGSILIETGGADPMVPPADVEAIRSELTNAGVTFQVDVYPGALHAFTNPAATDIGKQFNLPVAYDASADAKSWQALVQLLQQTWSKTSGT